MLMQKDFFFFFLNTLNQGRERNGERKLNWKRWKSSWGNVDSTYGLNFKEKINAEWAYQPSGGHINLWAL